MHGGALIPFQAYLPALLNHPTNGHHLPLIMPANWNSATEHMPCPHSHGIPITMQVDSTSTHCKCQRLYLWLTFTERAWLWGRPHSAIDRASWENQVICICKKQCLKPWLRELANPAPRSRKLSEVFLVYLPAFCSRTELNHPKQEPLMNETDKWWGGTSPAGGGKASLKNRSSL